MQIYDTKILFLISLIHSVQRDAKTEKDLFLDLAGVTV